MSGSGIRRCPALPFTAINDGSPETPELIRKADALAAELYPAR